jgi:transposase InsO family protein
VITRLHPSRADRRGFLVIDAGTVAQLATLDRVCRQTGYPKTIRVDQGSEFVSRDMDLWAYQRGVTLDFSRPGKPTDNALIEAFNGRFRAECLNTHWFLTVADAAEKLEAGANTITRNDHTARSGTTSRSC